MKGIDRAYMNASIEALISGYQGLCYSPIEEAIAPVRYGKSDTKSLDSIPEIAIAEVIEKFDSNAVLITEERGSKQRDRQLLSDGGYILFSDPTDGSNQLNQFLSHFNPKITVGQALSGDDALISWETVICAPADITGPWSAITCVKAGKPIFAVMLNYLTRDLLIVAIHGITKKQLPPYNQIGSCKLDYEITTTGEEIKFLPVSHETDYDRYRQYVTYKEKKIYEDNFLDCGIFRHPDDMPKPICQTPPGPARPLYLSSLNQANTVGFIAANGEKIGEWAHWLPFVRFAKYNGEPVLKLYEVTHERPWTNNEILMAPSPPYSIFDVNPQGICRLDPNKLKWFDNLSHFRSTLIIAPDGNHWINQEMGAWCYRELKFDFDE